MSYIKHAALATATLGLLLGQPAQSNEQAPKAPRKASKAEIKRGDYLVRITGCNDCHTPWKMNTAKGAPEPDMSRMLSGHPEGGMDPVGKHTLPDMAVIGPSFTSFAMPFGIVYTTNLTPDKETGLGSWTEADFLRMARNGRHMGVPSARPVLPPMPAMVLQNMTDQDLKAIFAFLQTIPAIKNKVPEPKVPPQVIQGMTEGANKAAQMAGDKVK
jgi:hypothetical protein